MNAAELMKRVIEYGGDEKGIKDRFIGNAQLYESCFYDFLEEPNFILLRQSIVDRDYEKAFESAHAIKGISGNLGLLPVYDAVCVLVESLRHKKYEKVEAEYEEVLRRFQEVKQLASEEEWRRKPEPEDTSLPEERDKGRKKDRLLYRLAILFLIILLCMGMMLCRISVNYKENISQESANHLIEINYQMKLYVEEKIANDWKTAYGTSDDILYNNYLESDDEIFKMMQRKRDMREVTDIMIYTENGYSICSDGETKTNDVSSDTIYMARKLGKYMSVIDSEIIYTVPLDTNLRYNGSRIAAVSVVQSMESFLDDMGFSSFDGKAWMYLTDEKGVVISKLTNEAAIPAFNFQAILDNHRIRTLKTDASQGDDPMSVTVPTAFIMSGDEADNYVVSTPVEVDGTSLRLFYLAPVEVVNEAMNRFSSQLIFISMFALMAFTALAALSFLIIYRRRKRGFDKAIIARERMFNLLVENTQTAFALFDEAHNEPIYVSGNVERITGEKLLLIENGKDGLYVSDYYGGDSDVTRQINESMAGWDGKSEFRSGYIANNRTKPPKWFDFQIFPMDGELKEYVCVAQDVTQMFIREDDTKRALGMAEQANAAKTRFLSNMSHDIRTPMNAIVNMANFAMEDMDKPKELRNHLKIISESAEHLLMLINDILDMSRIESGMTVIVSEPFDIKAELKKLRDIVRPLCEAKKQILITDFDGIVTTGIMGDRVKVSQIFMNLLSNAVKFTPNGGAVRFTAEELETDRDNLIKIRFTIEDNGIGISKEFKSHIFEPFSREDEKRVSKIQGTGLGLSICHSYVEAMGGSIICESEERNGSIFIVELSFEKAGYIAEYEEKEYFSEGSLYEGMHCLLCEDNKTNRMIAKTILERLGFRVSLALDGKEGLDAFLESRKGYFDLIYMDIQMPNMDGYETAVAIRESDHPQADNIPIIAMTANVFAEDVEKASISGMNGHVGKPISTMELVKETNRVLNRKGR